eukprot:GILJ01003093.1.p1 GENE.GILJ01003093.1~~GILJ01003093.1.p1  ORF type:complete len:318 (+),score=21.26 GILJ01003093.1:55-1008(+)
MSSDSKWTRVRRSMSLDYGSDLNDLQLDAEDIGGGHTTRSKADAKFLGDYTKEDIWALFREFHALEQFQANGFRDLSIELDDSDPFVSRLIVSDASIQHLPQGDNFLVDCYLRRRPTKLGEFKSYQRCQDQEIKEFMQRALGNRTWQCTFVEWLRMQNPLRGFDATRPQLPGQRHPGLRAGRQVSEMLAFNSIRKHRDGLVNYPEHFHNGFIFSNVGNFFLSPAYEGFYRTLRHDLKRVIEKFSLAEIAWAIESGHVMDTHKHCPLRWSCEEEQIFAASSEMKAYFESAEYIQLVKKHTSAGRFVLDEQHIQLPVST